MFKFKFPPLILFLISVLFWSLSSKYNKASQIIYTNNINKFTREKLSSISKLIDISIGDIIIIIALILFVVILLNLCRRLFKPNNLLAYLIRLFWGSVNIFCLIFFMYIILYGLNYKTPYLGDSMIKEYNKINNTSINVSVDNEKRGELYNYLEKMSKENRALVKTSSISEDLDLNQASEIAMESYRILSNKLPNLEGDYSKAKESILSNNYLSLYIDGNYSILTNEISINKNVPDKYLPFIVCKFMAYQRGIAREDEADFYAYMVCINSPDPRFKYSGYLSGLSMVLESIRINDRIDYNKFISEMDKGIKADLDVIENYKLNYGQGGNLFIEAKNIFKRLNGDVRIDGEENQTTDLLGIYYSLNQYN